MANVNINFVRYCKAFLEERCGLNDVEAQILVLDPELGPPMDDAKRHWAQHHFPADPDEILLSKRFDAAGMRQINTLLSKFAGDYTARAPRILSYLRSIGHPLSDMSDHV